jgi:hypothetical protein
MKKRPDPRKQENKKMIAARMSPKALQTLQEFSKRFPGISQAGIMEVSLYNLKKTSDKELKELFFNFLKGNQGE